MLHGAWVWQSMKGVCRVDEEHPSSALDWCPQLLEQASISTPRGGRGSAKHEHRGECPRNQPPASTSRTGSSPTSHGIFQTTQPHAAVGDLQGLHVSMDLQSPAEPSASIPLYRCLQQVFNNLQSVVSAWPALVSDDLVPLWSLSCKWRDSKSLASSNSHLDIAGTDDNEGF